MHSPAPSIEWSVFFAAPGKQRESGHGPASFQKATHTDKPGAASSHVTFGRRVAGEAPQAGVKGRNSQAGGPLTEPGSTPYFPHSLQCQNLYILAPRDPEVLEAPA